MKNLKFGDYVVIEQKRFGIKNELYLHKVIGVLRSNSYVNTPVQSPAIEQIHPEVEDVVACICCGVQEREVKNYKLSDVNKVIMTVKD